MTGGYILLDFTKYILDYNITSADDIADANEITKDEYDAIIKKFALSKNTAKPLVIKTKYLFDSSITNLTSNEVFFNGYAGYISYNDFENNDVMIVAVTPYNDKYYIFASNNNWFI